MFGTSDSTTVNTANPLTSETEAAGARSATPITAAVEVISTASLSMAPDPAPPLEGSGCWGFFTNCMTSLTQIIKTAASHPLTRPIVSFVLAAASAALSYVAAETYQDDNDFDAVYAVIPSTVFAGFFAQLAMEYLLPERMKKINYYRTMYPFEILCLPGFNFFNGTFFALLFPETHSPKQQEWATYFFTASFLGLHFGEISANLVRRLNQENQKGKVNVEMKMLSSDMSQTPQKMPLPSYLDKPKHSCLYQLGTVFFSLTTLSVGYFIRYQYSQRNSIGALSVFSMLLRHAGFAMLGMLTMDFMLPKVKGYDANTLQQISLYLLGPTIQLGNQPYNDVWLLLSGMILKLNQHYANESFIHKNEQNTFINAQLINLFGDKQKLIEGMQKNILKQMHDNRWKERLVTWAYDISFISFIAFVLSVYTRVIGFSITSAFMSFTLLSCVITPKLYQWLDDTAHQTTLTLRQNKIRENLDYYLLHNLIPFGSMSIYAARMYIRYRRLANYPTLVYPSASLHDNYNPVTEPLALTLSSILGLAFSLYFGFFRQTRKVLSVIDFNQTDFMKLSNNLLSIEAQGGENADKENVLELSYSQQAEILRRIGMFPSREKSDVIATTGQNNLWDKVNIRTMQHPPYEKAQYLRSRRMNAFVNAVAVSSNVTSRMSVVDEAKNIVFGL